jgi:hypothetical protein
MPTIDEVFALHRSAVDLTHARPVGRSLSTFPEDPMRSEQRPPLWQSEAASKHSLNRR